MSLKRYDLAGHHGRVLATRTKGRDAAEAAAAALASAEGGLILSFWHVDVASPPFLDEVVRALRAVLMDTQTHRFLLVTGANEDVKESLEMVLDRQKMQMAALQDDQIELLGGATHLEETLTEALQMGEFSAPELAERLKVRLPALHQRLNALLEAGAITQEVGSRPGRGRKKTFTAPKREEVARDAAPPPAPPPVDLVTA